MFRELLKEKNITQVQLAKYLSYSQQNISKWVKCLAEPDLETIGKIAELLGCKWSELAKIFNEQRRKK